MLFSAQTLRFRPRWWGAVLAVSACVLTVSLGHWQTGRAEEKRALAERFEEAARVPPTPVPSVAANADGLVFKRLIVTGQFLPQFTVLLDNKVYRGRPGYFVITPLRIAAGPMHVLVNRGWTAAGKRREDLPSIATPPGEVTLEGLGLEHAPRVFSPGKGTPEGRVWQGLVLEQFASWSGLPLQPVFLEQQSDLRDGLVRDWPKPDFGIDRHTSYAMQWYLIAALSVVLFFSLSIVRDRHPAG
jgi:surfeit locus 1 family protein